MTETKNEIERIKSIIENHICCRRLFFCGGVKYEIRLNHPFSSCYSDAQSHNGTETNSLKDLAMYLEKVRVSHSREFSVEKGIEQVKKFRIENNLQLS